MTPELLLDQTQEHYYFTYILPIIDLIEVEMLQQHGFNFTVFARPRSKNRISRQNFMIKQFKLVEVRQNLIISPSVPPAPLLAQCYLPSQCVKDADVEMRINHSKNEAETWQKNGYLIR